MIYYIVGVVSALQKDAKDSHEQMKQAFPDRQVFVYITDDNEYTGYHDITERFERKYKPFDENRLLDRLEKERAAWIDP